MKKSIAQLNYHIGNFEGNTDKMINAILEAKSEGADIICFSELATCGYPPRDFLEFDDFVRLSDESIARLCTYAIDIAVVVGAPSHNSHPKRKSLFNSVYFLSEGKIQFVQHKTLLRTYDIFDEYRYFEPAYDWHVMQFKGKKLAVTVCEDIWNLGNNPLYRICPMDKLIQQAPDLMINLSASPFDYTHIEDRKAEPRQRRANVGWLSRRCPRPPTSTSVYVHGQV